MRVVSWKEGEGALLRKALSILESGGILVIPSETLYALSGDATRKEAVARVFSLKARERDKPLSLFLPSLDWIPDVAALPALADEVARRFLPGPLTLVLKAKMAFPQGVEKRGKVGIRISSHPLPGELALLLGRPITATSANIGGERDVLEVSELPLEISEGVDLVIDGGKLEGIASTVVDFTSHPPKILREGAISQKELEQFWGKGHA